MKLKMILLVGLALLLSCSAYKELKPKMPPTPQELGYIELLDKDKNFELKKGKKYFTTFPDAAMDDFYLVLRAEEMDNLSTYLTRQFDDGKGNIVKLPDGSLPDDNLNVYQMDHSVPFYYWVIESVAEDMELDLDYRYVPIWRYQFESRSADFQTKLARNTVNRQDYDGLGTVTQPADLDTDAELADVARKTANLRKLQSELEELEAIFPAHILDSDDPAYRDFVALKLEIENELQFQDDYQAIMRFFQLERATRYDDAAFVAAIPELRQTFDRKTRIAPNVLEEMKKTLSPRLAAIAPQFNREIRAKRDASPINLPADDALALFQECGEVAPQEMQSVANFVRRYNQHASALASVNERLGAINQEVADHGFWPADGFYPGLVTRLGELRGTLPAGTPAFGDYANQPAANALNRALNTARQQLSDRQAQFRRAGNLVTQINRHRSSGDYRAISELLKVNNDLDFLIDQYPDLDEMSLNQQEAEISAALDADNYTLAESRIRQLYSDENFINYAKIRDKKLAVVRRSEDRLVSAVEEGSKLRIDAFIAENKTHYGDVEALYQNEAFQPLYALTFSAAGSGAVDNHNKRVLDYLNGLKHDRFPAMAIEALYAEFSRDPHDDGVARARAIATHGKYYAGTNRTIKNLVAEVDPNIPKWITRAAEYRKIFVLPVNATQKNSNEYMFRLNLQVPSEARFPVFDVNIKLPREVAKDAAERQWYTSMTMNGDVLKNEGRFTITAPTKENAYECQITPLQVNKEGNNILEVRFNHDAFKVLEVSVMAQRPIIKKN